MEDTTNWDKKLDNVLIASSVALDPSDGSVYVVGVGQNLVSGSSGNDWWITKFSSGGVEDTTNWDKKFSSSGENSDFAKSVAIDPSDGSVYVVGNCCQSTSKASSNWWIKKFTSDGVEK